jgi:hypothetical protein
MCAHHGQKRLWSVTKTCFIIGLLCTISADKFLQGKRFPSLAFLQACMYTIYNMDRKRLAKLEQKRFIFREVLSNVRITILDVSLIPI